jgi:hypothetical protein
MANSIEAAGARSAVAVTKSDTAANAYDALYVGGTGDVTVITKADETTAFVGIPAGSILPIGTKKVMAATTATSIVGLIY